MLNVLFASDNNYTPFLSIAIVSLLEHNQSEFDEINIFILDDGISEENGIKLKKLLDGYKCNVTFIKTKQLDELDIAIMTIERNINISSLTAYARLFICNLLPKNIEKILYLDCDSIIVGSLKELWMEDITDYYCAGVLDCMNTTIKQEHGFSRDDDYINSGVLLINLKKWRQDNVEEEFIEFMIQNQHRFYQHDQGIINNVFKNKIKIVDPRYNLAIHFQTFDYDLSRKFNCIETEYYSKEIIEEAQKHPVFLHFCGSEYFRPWYNPEHPYAPLFKKYAELVGCEDIIDYTVPLPQKHVMFYRAMANPIGKIILKLIPTSIVQNMINKNALQGLKEDNLKAQELCSDNNK